MQTSQQRLESVRIQSQRLDRCLPVNQDWDSEASDEKPANCALVLAEAGQASLVRKPEMAIAQSWPMQKHSGTYALLTHTHIEMKNH